MTVKSNGFTPILPSDVFQMIGFSHDFVINHLKNEPTHQKGEIFDEKYLPKIEEEIYKMFPKPEE